ncbi:peptidylprolyl isomerase [Seongchinamella sediminis]|uniref:Periplasmic chaperone PpiD n=1 Tax=Seongchinamella sediminis TaxID=2283635 RepID=A0A3L7E3W1_9GAMM|nr:SurA N-terminal domain-containing protein [Seongchinamella sediminis]RLQ23111.1 peptidylprolyl isomerase [Seongchinamella sediminis]
MLQDIRKNSQGTMAKIIVGVIVVAFAGFGLESILLGGGNNSVAEVNGEQISPLELQQAVDNQKRQLISMMGENIDPTMLDDQRLSQQAMQSLIQRKLLLQSAEDMGLTVSAGQVGAVVASMEQFKLDGQFSPDMYRARLGEAGFTPTSFKQAMVEDMTLGQARSGLAGSEFATPAELELNARIVGEQRDLRYLTIPLATFASETEVSAGDVEAYYNEHADEFLSEEAVELDYIELRAEDFRAPVEEQAIVDAYREEIVNGQYQTETRVSHILFEQGSDESDEAFARRIADVQDRLAGGADFAEVAGDASDDIGSTAFGGDLGFTAGDAFPAEMEEAIAALDVNAVSEPVATDAGVHIIKVTERREGEPPPLEELRPQLEEQLAMAEAQVELLLTVETLKDLAFNAQDLQAPATEMSLQVQRSERVSRNQEEGLFAEPALLAAAFSDEVLNAGHNSDVIELSPEHWVVVSVREHHPAEVLPLAAVEEEIIARITDERARAAVEAAAIAAARSLRAGDSVESFAKAAGYEWQVELGASRRNSMVPAEILASAFLLAPPAEGESVVDYVVNTSGDALVYEVARVSPGSLAELAEAERGGLQQMVGAEYSQLIDNEYRQGLRESADINVL